MKTAPINKRGKTIALALGSTFMLGIGAASVQAAENPFALSPLSNGYQVADNHADKTKDGKCGEGKCGTEGKAMDTKAKDGKCGEGKCGAEGKTKDGKCGEGKCGAEMKSDPITAKPMEEKAAMDANKTAAVAETAPAPEAVAAKKPVANKTMAKKTSAKKRMAKKTKTKKNVAAAS